jgi:hypothetical protein
MNEFDEFLKRFFNTEIYFLSNPSLQYKTWVNAIGEEHFGGFLLRFFESWETIVENQQNFNIPMSLFNNIQKLCNMLDSFQKTINYPTTPSEYLALINNPKWKEVQDYAQHLYHFTIR